LGFGVTPDGPVNKQLLNAMFEDPDTRSDWVIPTVVSVRSENVRPELL